MLLRLFESEREHFGLGHRDACGPLGSLPAEEVAIGQALHLGHRVLHLRGNHAWPVVEGMVALVVETPGLHRAEAHCPTVDAVVEVAA